ncbi:MAG: CocE/NonD family hydrolase [Acidobacteria bacterium]|nr:CocE/NonD family hydrolase [Acidobacteriota bacterium]
MKRTLICSAVVCVLAGGAPLYPSQARAQTHSTHKTAHADESAMQAAVGVYAQIDEPDILLSISREGHRLYVEGARSPKLELHTAGIDRFTATNGQMYDFERDNTGNFVGMSLSSGHTGTSAIRSYKKISSTPQQLNHYRAYVRSEAMIPMRDGARLHTVILRPAESGNNDPLPFLMTRTPYGVDGFTSDYVNSSKPEMAASGYIFVAQDMRGRYKSEGTFVMNRPLVHTLGDRTDPSKIDESTDAYDTVEWLVKHVPNNNGRVGVYGVSYPGFLTIMAEIDHHPAVMAVSPQAPMTDVWLGDDFFHNGAFRETYAFDYVQQLEAQKTDKRVSMQEDIYSFFLRYGNFENAAKAANMAHLPTARYFIEQPEYTKFWRDMSVLPHLTKVEVPTLEVGGYFDQEDMFGTQAEYAALHAHEQTGGPRVYMVLGPWNHGRWNTTTRHLGALDFGEPTGDEYRKRYEFPFFEKFLKERSGFNLPDTATFRTGTNKWQEYKSWPPPEGFHVARLYLSPHMGLSFTAPRGKNDRAAASYVSDPSNPIPYRERPIESTYGNGSRWRPWLSTSQAFLKDRKDILSFSTPPLEKDTTITGDILADIFASTSGSDADWVVKLIDAYPADAPAPMAGYQVMIVDEIFRGRYLHSFQKAGPLESNKITEFKWSLHAADHTFRKGHQIMVQIQSTWFPLYDRNPQTFVPNIMTAPAEAYKAQTHTIYFSAKHPSHLEVMVPDSER